MAIEDEFERDTRAMERIATALEKWVELQQKRFDKEYPEPRPKRDAELIRADDSTATRAEQYRDKADPRWFEETPKESEPSRFAKRAEETGVKAAPEKRRRAVEVPEGNGNKAEPS